MRRTEVSFLAASAVITVLLAGACSDDKTSDGGDGSAAGAGAGGEGATTGASGGTNASGSGGSFAGRGGVGGTGGTAGDASGGAADGGSSSGMGGATGGAGGDAAGEGGAASGTGGTGGESGVGWLYTKGNKIYVSDGKGGGNVWVGRGVNTDDIFLCGYNYTLWMPSPEDTVTSIISGLMRDWKPTFIRISLAMATFQATASWLENEARYRQPMTAIIDAIGAYPNTYVLVSVRSDLSMILHDEEHGNPEATGLPSDSANTPNAAEFPEGTDDLYRALVQSFGDSKHVLFGITNEPGGNLQTSQRIRSAMVHAVDTIRAEEDRLGVPHHVVAVQGNVWSSDISVYATSPLTQDNVVYEVHGYPPSTDSYTYSNLPVILGEYGLDASMSAAFFADLEAKQIPSLAWDFAPYSNCSPDLVEVTQDATVLTPTPWGELVQDYLLAHAP